MAPMILYLVIPILKLILTMSSCPPPYTSVEAKNQKYYKISRLASFDIKAR